MAAGTGTICQRRGLASEGEWGGERRGEEEGAEAATGGSGGEGGHKMFWGHGNPRCPLQSSHLLCSDEQAGRKAPRSLGTGSWTSKQNQQATSPTRGRSPQSTRFWKVAKSHHWGFTWLKEAPPALHLRPLSMPMRHCGATGSGRKEICPLCLAETFVLPSDSLTWGFSMQPKNRHSRSFSSGKNSPARPALALRASSSQPHQGCKTVAASLPARPP